MSEIIVEVIDRGTRCIVNDWCFAVRDTKDLARVLGKKDLKIDDSLYLEVSKKKLLKILNYFNTYIVTKNEYGIVRAKNSMDDLPYKVHTNRELALMLSGIKPLAFFCGSDASGADLEYYTEPFEKYVESGTIVEFKHFINNQDFERSSIYYIIYTLPSEEWRAKALIVLKESQYRSGWSEGMERMEGVLLGYSDEQIDWYINNIYRRNKNF